MIRLQSSTTHGYQHIVFITMKLYIVLISSIYRRRRMLAVYTLLCEHCSRWQYLVLWRDNVINIVCF